MTKIIDFSDRETIEREAAEWLIRLDGDKAMSVDEMLRLRQWMRRSPAHREALLSFGEFWSNQSLVALPISLEALYYEPPVARHQSKVRLNSLQQFRPAAIVASLFIVVAVALFARGGWFGMIDSAMNEHSAHYMTAVGQQKTVTLPDGSIIYLNTNSQLKIDFDKQHRNILLLQGEAHFEVAKQAERPFRVYAGKGRVQALGTAFTVYLRDSNDIDVTVTEGKVALAVLDNMPLSSATKTDAVSTLSKASEYVISVPVDELDELEAGQMATIVVAQEVAHKVGQDAQGRLGEVKSIQQAELQRLGAWRSGMLVFAGDSLEDVVAEIGRYTTLSIEIIDPELRSIRIGGRFNASDTSELFDALEANFNLEVVYLNYNRVQISSATKKI